MCVRYHYDNYDLSDITTIIIMAMNYDKDNNFLIIIIISSIPEMITMVIIAIIIITIMTDMMMKINN